MITDSSPNYRFLSASVAFAAVTAPAAWFYLGVVARASAGAWLGASLALGGVVGVRYRRRPYSLVRLWDFARAVWKGLVVAAVAIYVVFRVQPGEVRDAELVGRLFFGGLAFVPFVVVYGGAYLSSYVREENDGGAPGAERS